MSKTKIMERIDINLLKENPDNPRFITDSKFKKLVKSIKKFPQMLEKRPIVVDEEMVVLGGNMRLKACKEVGLKEVWISIAKDWTDEQKKEFIIKDNIGFGEWDWDILSNEWSDDQLQDWGLDVPTFNENNDVDDFSDKLSDEYKIEISLDNEIEQEKLYNELIEKGYTCRILTL